MGRPPGLPAVVVVVVVVVVTLIIFGNFGFFSAGLPGRREIIKETIKEIIDHLPAASPAGGKSLRFSDEGSLPPEPPRSADLRPPTNH